MFALYPIQLSFMLEDTDLSVTERSTTEVG